jgi:hypothetical protein
MWLSPSTLLLTAYTRVHETARYSPANPKVALERLQLVSPCILRVPQAVPAGKLGGVSNELQNLQHAAYDKGKKTCLKVLPIRYSSDVFTAGVT